jgi:hypothetical protein
MARADAGDGAEFEASGAQYGEAGALDVLLDRGADVQSENLLAGRDGNALHGRWDARMPGVATSA